MKDLYFTSDIIGVLILLNDNFYQHHASLSSHEQRSRADGFDSSSVSPVFKCCAFDAVLNAGFHLQKGESSDI